MAVHHALAADLLLINGRVLTLDVHNSVAQAVAVRDGKIVAVGTNAECRRGCGRSGRGGGGEGSQMMKVRNPRPEIRKKSEARTTDSKESNSDFRIRISFGFRHSKFGFRLGPVFS